MLIVAFIGFFIFGFLIGYLMSPLADVFLAAKKRADMAEAMLAEREGGEG